LALLQQLQLCFLPWALLPPLLICLHPRNKQTKAVMGKKDSEEANGQSFEIGLGKLDHPAQIIIMPLLLYCLSHKKETSKIANQCDDVMHRSL
jgi:hypothetical protein